MTFFEELICNHVTSTHHRLRVKCVAQGHIDEGGDWTPWLEVEPANHWPTVHHTAFLNSLFNTVIDDQEEHIYNPSLLFALHSLSIRLSDPFDLLCAVRRRRNVSCATRGRCSTTTATRSATPSPTWSPPSPTTASRPGGSRRTVRGWGCVGKRKTPPKRKKSVFNVGLQTQSSPPRGNVVR